MQLRRLPASIETLAADWAKKAVSTDPWVETGPFGGSDSAPFKVALGTLEGLAKPGVRKPEPYAATEKIISDLAYHVGMPVPPVVLWDRGSDPKFAPPAERYVAISAWVFAEDWTWDKALPGLKDEEKKALEPVFSGMRVFDTWVSANEDRAGKHALLNSKDFSQMAFIDYAFSMLRYWKDTNYPDGGLQGFNPMTDDRAAMKHVAERIAALDSKVIDEIVTRVQDNYLNALQKSIICANLKHRATRILDIVGF